MDLLNKLTIKNLKLNKKRTIVTIIGIVLSVALITAVASMFFSTRASLIRFTKKENGNYHYHFSGVEKEGVEELRLNRKIESMYLTENIGYSLLEGIKNEYKPYVFVSAMTKDAMKNLGVRLVEGRMPENASEILIPKHLATNGGVDLNVGETITLSVGERTSDGISLIQENPFNPERKEEIIDSREITYKIVGEMERLSSGIEGYSAPGYTFITYTEEADMSGVTEVYIRFTKEGLSDEEKFIISIAEEKGYGYGSNSYLIQLETGILGDSTLSVLASVAMIVVVIIILTSVFCIKNSFDISITEKIRQYGMLSSIGATKKQIRKNVYFEACILGAIGMPLGIISGVFASFILMHVSNYYLKGEVLFDLVFEFSWVAIVFAVLLGAVTIFLSARKSAVKAGKIAPIQAIRNSGDIKVKPSKVKCPKYISKIFGIGGEISYKNLQRNKKKYRTTVVSITMCVAVFIALSYFTSLVFGILNMEFQSSEYNLSVIYRNEEEMPDYVTEIRKLDGINQMTAMSSAGYNMKEYTFTEEYQVYWDTLGIDEAEGIGITAFVMNEISYKEYLESVNLDYDEMKEKAVLFNTVYVDIYDKEKETYVETEMEQFALQKGDRITGLANILNENETVEGEIVEMEIGAVVNEPPMAISSKNRVSYLFVGESMADKLLGTDHYNYIYIDAKNADQTQKDIEEIIDSSDEEKIGINNVEEVVRTAKSVYTLMGIFLYGLITVIALIGITNIFNTITTNMSLRRREFAMLRSIGMTSKEFNRMIQLESFFYGMKSLLIGVPVGCVLSYVMHYVMSQSDVVLKYQLPIGAIVMAALAVFALITVIMNYSISKIKKHNMIETIRNENI